MKAINKAIKDKWDAEASLNIYPLYFDAAPQEAAMPYVVYQKITGIPEFTFNTEMQDDRYQFSAFSSKNSAEEVLTMYEAIIAIFDDVVLPIVGYTPVLFERANEVPDKTPEEAWQYNIEYRVLNSKN